MDGFWGDGVYFLVHLAGDARSGQYANYFRAVCLYADDDRCRVWQCCVGLAGTQAFPGFLVRLGDSRVCRVCLDALYGGASSGHVLFRLTGSFFNPGPYSCFLAVGGTVAFDRILEKGGFELQAIVPGYGCFAEGIVVGLGLSSTGGGFFAPE